MRIAAIAAAAALALTAQVAAQQPGPPGGMAGMPEMAEHMRMTDSLNVHLDTLVNRMNRATGNKKVTAMADVINELVAQRRAMQGHMRQMMESQRGMMMQEMGKPAPAKGPLTSGADSTAADTGHAAHHPPN
ncbi:MAG TPA: hypothetical protein VEU27_10950 [Gemmatimonadales bacterium]|nr:hypothetical protein [Gemmatimonadales bacterium]